MVQSELLGFGGVMAAPARPIAEGEPLAVCIATKNRPTYLAALLASLVGQTYARWSLVVNDQSDPPAEADDTVRDLLQLIETRGHRVHVFHTDEPRDRYQRAMEAAPAGVELIVRVDDDVVLAPDYLERIVRPFHFFPQRRIAAVGGCLPEPHMTTVHPLGVRLADAGWVPRIDRPTWRLQGHCYDTREIIEVESLWGCSMCYRRSAAEAVGGWAVAGQSEQVYREDSDMSARWLVAGWELLVTTEALGSHLVAPAGGSRRYRKSPRGNVLISDRTPFEADDRIFRARLDELMPNYTPRPTRRYRIEDLERGLEQARRLATPLDRLRHGLAWRVRRVARFFGLGARA